MTEKAKSKPWGSASGGDILYGVEARVSSGPPVPSGDFILDREWRRVPFQPSAAGVPTAPLYGRFNFAPEFVSYEAAEALRWWFHAHMLSQSLYLPLETRLVAVEVKWSYEILEKGVSDTQGRPCAPWGDFKESEPS